MNTPLTQAIDIFGTQERLATELSRATGSDVKQPYINYWLTKSKEGVPAKYCPAIHRLTGGRISVHDLRPDVYPAWLFAENVSSILANSSASATSQDKPLVNSTDKEARA